MKKILFAASEGVPFIKTGGLADVVGSLPKCIDKQYFDVRVILPKYACMKQEMKDKMSYVSHFYITSLTMSIISAAPSPTATTRSGRSKGMPISARLSSPYCLWWASSRI